MRDKQRYIETDTEKERKKQRKRKNRTTQRVTFFP